MTVAKHGNQFEENKCIFTCIERLIISIITSCVDFNSLAWRCFLWILLPLIFLIYFSFILQAQGRLRCVGGCETTCHYVLRYFAVLK